MPNSQNTYLNPLNGIDLFEMVVQLITDDDDLGDRIIGGGGLTNRALVVRSQTPTLVWARDDKRRTGIPEIDRLLTAPHGSIGLTAKREAANLYAAAAELSAAVDAGGEPVGVVVLVWLESGLDSVFHYPLERYKNDAAVESYLAEQENILREAEERRREWIEAAEIGEAVNWEDAQAERDALAEDELEARFHDEEARFHDEQEPPLRAS